MIEIKPTKHAKEVLERRGIAIRWVEHVLNEPILTIPDSLDPVLEHRLARIPEYGNRVLRIIINPQIQPIRLITAYFDRKMKDAL